MIDRDSVRAYDAFVAGLRPLPLETQTVAVGPLRRARVVVPLPSEPPYDEQVEVVVLGAGPSGLLIGSLLARHGHQVVVLEARPRLDCGATWNISRDELGDLVETRAIDPALWSQIVVGCFDEGVFRLHDGDAGGAPKQPFKEYAFNEILNVSLDERLFLETLAGTSGLELRLSTHARLQAVTAGGAFVAASGSGEGSTIRTRLLIDASGWSSPLACLVHPWRQVESVYNMVGVHVSQRLDRENGRESGRPLGLICVTRGDEVLSPDGWVQPILERFSGAVPDSSEDHGEVLYYFTRTPRRARLEPLLAEMVAQLPEFAPGFDERLVDRTFYGHGPGYYAPRPCARFKVETSAGDRLVLVGCAAQQYSGLTGCAFGPLVRNAREMARAIHRALVDDDLRFRRLRRIDIDPRERISQEVEELFGGAMMRDQQEQAGCVNRDWIGFCEAAKDMDATLKNEAFRDKLRLAALNQLLPLCAKRLDVVRALRRNNGGRLWPVIATFVSAYLRLLWHEARLLLTRRERKYATAGLVAVARSPLYAWHSWALLARGRDLNKGS